MEREGEQDGVRLMKRVFGLQVARKYWRGGCTGDLPTLKSRLWREGESLQYAISTSCSTRRHEAPLVRR